MDNMSSTERVMKALNFQEPDHVPRYEGFWGEFIEAWRTEKKFTATADPWEYYNIDLLISAPDETAWPTKARILEKTSDYQTILTGWGSVHRWNTNANFFSEVKVALEDRVDIDKLSFDSPYLDSRYEHSQQTVEKNRNRFAVFGKTGGPYMRASYMRGITNFLMDIAEDPEWVKALVEKVTDHLLAIGVEQIQRMGLANTGIGIFDDIANNQGPLMGLKTYEKLFYPSLRKMVKAYKQAGAAKVFHHCDGYIENVLDLWVDAGIDAVHPLEARLGMDPLEIRRRYEGKLAIIGGLDNSIILPSGNYEEIRKHVLRVLDAGRGGGLVLAAHSIGPDISVTTYDYITELWKKYGRYPLHFAKDD